MTSTLAVKAKNEGYSSIALLGRNDLVTSQCKEGATNVLNLSVFETYTPGDMDFKAQLSKIKASQSEALILYGLADECPVLFKQIKELGLDARLFLPVQSFACGSDANTKSYEGLLSGAFGSDIALDESSQDPVFLSFKKRLDERNWSIHIRGSALEYDIVNEMAEAYHGCQDRSCAADHLRAMRRKGITGEVSYNGGQIVKREVMLTRYSDGKWVKGD